MPPCQEASQTHLPATYSFDRVLVIRIAQVLPGIPAAIRAALASSGHDLVVVECGSQVSIADAESLFDRVLTGRRVLIYRWQLASDPHGDPSVETSAEGTRCEGDRPVHVGGRGHVVT